MQFKVELDMSCNKQDADAVPHRELVLSNKTGLDTIQSQIKQGFGQIELD